MSGEGEAAVERQGDDAIENATVDDLLGEEELDYGEEDLDYIEIDQQVDGEHDENLVEEEEGGDKATRMGRPAKGHVVPSPRDLPRSVPAMYYEQSFRDEAAPSGPPPPPPPPRDRRPYGREGEGPGPSMHPRPTYSNPQSYGGGSGRRGAGRGGLGGRGSMRHPAGMMHLQGRVGGFIPPPPLPHTSAAGPQVMMVMLPTGEMMPVVPINGGGPVRIGNPNANHYQPPPPPRLAPGTLHPPKGPGGAYIPIRVVGDDQPPPPPRSGLRKDEASEGRDERDAADDNPVIDDMPDLYPEEEGVVREERFEDLDEQQPSISPHASHQNQNQKQGGDGRYTHVRGGSHVGHRGGGVMRGGGQGGRGFYQGGAGRGAQGVAGPKKWVRAEASGSAAASTGDDKAGGGGGREGGEKVDPAEELKRRLQLIEERKRAKAAEALAAAEAVAAAAAAAETTPHEKPSDAPLELTETAAEPVVPHEPRSVVQAGPLIDEAARDSELLPASNVPPLKENDEEKVGEAKEVTSGGSEAVKPSTSNQPETPQQQQAAVAPGASSMLAQEMQRLKRMIEMQEEKLKKKQRTTS